MNVMQMKIVWSKKRIVLVAVIIGVVLLAIGGMIFWIETHKVPAEPAASQSDTSKAAAAAKQAEADGKLRDTAAQDIKGNNSAAAQKTYQKAIDSESSIERKTLLYIDLSGVYYAAGQYDQAFAVAKQAEATNPDKFLIADWLSRLYEDQKNYAQAAAYYRLAGESATSSQNKTALTKDYYDTQADRVTKLANGGV